MMRWDGWKMIDRKFIWTLVSWKFNPYPLSGTQVRARKYLDY
jgi:hypothetical protein